MFEVQTIIAILVTGLVAGTFGGMLGIGGSVIMIPALVFMFGQNETPGYNQHLYQAAAMIVNVAVLAPATYRHYKAGAIIKSALVKIIPFALLFVLIGVYLSNLSIFSGNHGPLWLGRVMAVFFCYVIVVNVKRIFFPLREKINHQHVTATRGLAVGASMGTVAGLLGVGGGSVAVPMQQVLMKLPLRNCIANSAAIICVTATFGAIYKNVTLAEHGLSYDKSLSIAALLIPTAIVGGYIGGYLTHALPKTLVRIVFIGIMAGAAYKMTSL